MAFRLCAIAFVMAISGCSLVTQVDPACFDDECDGGLDAADDAGGDTDDAAPDSDLECDEGTADCDGDPDNGCEVELMADPEHCGTCRQACEFDGAAGVCSAGECSLGECNEGREDCDGDPDNGCEIESDTDPMNCGECGVMCSDVGGTATCDEGECGIECTDNLRDCDLDASNGCEVNLMSDRAHCGSCDSALEDGVACLGGEGVAVIELGMGTTFACARLTSGALECWGNNARGQLGAGGFVSRVERRPVVIEGTDALLGDLVTDIDVSPNGHACAVAEDVVWCWGKNNRGQATGALGAAAEKAVRVSGVPDGASKVEVGVDSTCSLHLDGSVWCWGLNTSGQLGRGVMSTFSAEPEPVMNVAGAVDLTLGARHACALIGGSPQQVWCWGANSGLQISESEPPEHRAFAPVHVPALDGATSIEAASGGDRTCAEIDGGVRCVGDNTQGALLNETSATDGQTVGPSADDLVSTVGGLDFTCALTEDGQVVCMGSSRLGQTPPPPEFRFSLSDRVHRLYAGRNQACALLANGSIECWGEDGFRHISRAEQLDQATPVRTEIPANADAYSIGTTSCMLNEGDVSCWGWGNYGFGGDTFSTAEPIAIAGGEYSAITVNHSGRCVTDASGRALCWGRNEVDDAFAPTGNAGLGPGTIADPSSDHPVQGGLGGTLMNVQRVAIGFNSSCAIVDSVPGPIRCWGNNERGQLGNLTVVSRNNAGLFPLTLPNMRPAVDIAIGSSFACAILSDATVACWGATEEGQAGLTIFGDNLTLARRVDGLADVRQIAPGASHVCALSGPEDAGVVSCWGWGGRLQLGRASTSSSETPVVLDLGQPVTQIVSGRTFSCALLADGTAQCWGSNEYGQLGQGESGEDIALSDGAPVEGLTGIEELYSQSYGLQVCARLEGDDNLWCWGLDNYGSFGRGETVNFPTSEPTLMQGVPW